MNLFNLRRNPPSLDDLVTSPWQSSPRDNLSSECLMPSVERPQQIFVRGQGSWLWDSEDRAYLDFIQGAAANTLGHSPSALVKAMTAQAQALINPGAGFYNRGLLNLAERLCHSTGSDQAYLLGSDSEARDAAIQLARKWGRLHRGGAARVIRVGQDYAPAFNDLPALHADVDAQTVAIVLEPLQSTPQVEAASEHYLKGVERLCRELGILLILDETHTGMGRCGTLLAEQAYGVLADIVILGQGLGGGVPLAALLARGQACCFEVGEVGEQHHGNALTMAAGLAVLNSVLDNGFLAHVRESGHYLGEGLARLANRYAQKQVQGCGLLWSVQLADDSADAVVKAARYEGLLLKACAPDSLSFTPALTVSKGNIDEMLLRLARAFARVRTAQLQCRKGIAV